MDDPSFTFNFDPRMGPILYLHSTRFQRGEDDPSSNSPFPSTFDNGRAPETIFLFASIFIPEGYTTSSPPLIASIFPSLYFGY
jgi:hypothetical protein